MHGFGFQISLLNNLYEKPLDLSGRPFDSAEPTTPLIPKHLECGCCANWFLGDAE